MKPLYHALLAGVLVAVADVLLLQNGFTFWEKDSLTTAGLVAGIFFILAMIFQASLRDYKETDVHISGIRGTALALNDLNIHVAQKHNSYDPRPFGEYVAFLVQEIRNYIVNKRTYNEVQSVMNSHNYESCGLKSLLTQDEESLYLQQAERLRLHLSFMAYSKSLRFPFVGYLFLYFFIVILVGMHLFAYAENFALDAVYLFTLTVTLVFFAEFIRDLDRIFDRKQSSFVADIIPLQNCIQSIKSDLSTYEHHAK